MSSSPKMGLSMLTEQHQLLNSHMRTVVEALDQDQAADIVTARLADLINYVDLHFSMEEEVMAVNEYPRLKLHRNAHAAFRSKVRELHDCLDGSNTEIMETLVRLLERWLQKHEVDEDDRLLKFLAS